MPAQYVGRTLRRPRPSRLERAPADPGRPASDLLVRRTSRGAHTIPRAPDPRVSADKQRSRHTARRPTHRHSTDRPVDAQAHLAVKADAAPAVVVPRPLTRMSRLRAGRTESVPAPRGRRLAHGRA